MHGEKRSLVLHDATFACTKGFYDREGGVLSMREDGEEVVFSIDPSLPSIYREVFAEALASYERVFEQTRFKAADLSEEGAVTDDLKGLANDGINGVYFLDAAQWKEQFPGSLMEQAFARSHFDSEGVLFESDIFYRASVFGDGSEEADSHYVVDNTEDDTSNLNHFYSVTVHELGHAMGRCHSSNPESFMFSFAQTMDVVKRLNPFGAYDFAIFDSFFEMNDAEMRPASEDEKGRVMSFENAPKIDQLWNFSEPEKTREKFLELLNSYQEVAPLAYILELKTQIARTHSLKGEFEEAHRVLDEVQKDLEESEDRSLLLVKTRLHLERGRSFNSAGDKSTAFENFEKALLEARANQHDYYAVDAAHMLAISAPDFEAKVEWARKGIQLAEDSQDERTKSWLGKLYNNLAWDFHDKEKYDDALELFFKAKSYHDEHGNSQSQFVARWSVARCLRSLEDYTNALSIQMQLMEEMERESSPDGFVYEELAELYLVEGEKDRVQDFASKAVKFLSEQAAWLPQYEADRWQRLSELADGSYFEK